MKPTKKKNVQGARKIDTSQNQPALNIKSYYKVAAKQFVCEDKISDTIQSDCSKTVYIQALKDKLKSKNL